MKTNEYFVLSSLRTLSCSKGPGAMMRTAASLALLAWVGLNLGCGIPQEDTESVSDSKAHALVEPFAVEILGAEEGGFYSEEVTITWRVTGSSNPFVYGSVNGSVFYGVDEVTVTPEGKHRVIVTVGDRDSSVWINEEVNFVIDSTPPLIDVDGVWQGGCYRDAAPVVAYSDWNLATASVELNGEPFVSGTGIVEEGEYLLAVAATDLAGNESFDDRDFIIDRTPPEVILNQPLDGMVFNKSFPIYWTIEESSPYTVVEQTLNGAIFVGGYFNAAEGPYLLRIVVEDCAENRTVFEADFSIDYSPTIEFFGIEDGMVSSAEFLVPEIVTERADQVVALLNNVPYVSGTPITAEGDYTLYALALQSATGRWVTKTAFFSIDRTSLE